MNQIIIHVDMDAFYASVEMRDNPTLRGKPLVIGSMPNERGVVATCSYEARKYGIHSAMNIKEAYRRCPNGIYMPPNFDKYKAVSEQLHGIWNTYAEASEYVALDEAYLDVTKRAKTFDGAREIAQIIKSRTFDELGLSCSVGVAYSKTAAKTASEEKKPNGYFEIPDEKTFVDLMIDRDETPSWGSQKNTHYQQLVFMTPGATCSHTELFVKPGGAENSWLATACENREMPTSDSEYSSFLSIHKFSQSFQLKRLAFLF